MTAAQAAQEAAAQETLREAGWDLFEVYPGWVRAKRHGVSIANANFVKIAHHASRLTEYPRPRRRRSE